MYTFKYFSKHIEPLIFVCEEIPNIIKQISTSSDICIIPDDL